ncbi:MAG: ABC transporter substrate-binding protein [Actinomycetota bacterium]
MLSQETGCRVCGRRKARGAGRFWVGLVAVAVLTYGCAGKPSRTSGTARPAGSTADQSPLTDSAATTVPSETSLAGESAGATSAAGRSSRQVAPAPGTTKVPLTATDRGVTKDSIQLAWFEVEKAERQLGASVGMSWAATMNDPMYYVQPFVDEINEKGGINGRKVVPHLVEYQTMSFDNMQAACVSAAEDLKVFAAISGVGLWGQGEVCLANKQIPTITYNSGSSDQLYQQEKGWVRQTVMNKDRVVKNLADWLVDSKLVNAKTRIGVPYLDTPEYKQIVEKVLLPYLKSKGLNVAQTAVMSNNYERTPTEAAAAVMRFKSSNIEFVFPILTWWETYHFLSCAQSQNYKPIYTTSDLGELAKDPAASIFPAEQWDHTRGITAIRTGELAAGKQKTAQQKECEAVFISHGGAIESDSDRDYTWIVCEHMHLFTRAATLAGPNLTRERYLAALDTLGSYNDRVAISDTLTFAKGKWDAANRFAAIEWHQECKCYHQTEGFRSGRW